MDECMKVFAWFAGATLVFQLGCAYGGCQGYNNALDEVSIYGFEVVDKHWDRHKPRYLVRDKDLDRLTK